MLTTLAILSPDQGKLFRKPESEDAYYVRFGGTPETTVNAPEPRRWHFPAILFAALRSNPGK